ncbi:hypothetical protein V6N13_006292 [Hibiscus sabdariffa]
MPSPSLAMEQTVVVEHTAVAVGFGPKIDPRTVASDMEVVLPNLPAATAPLVPPIPNPSSLSVVSDLGDVAPLLSNSLANPPTPPSTKPFGPWMMVERRMCHNYRKAFTTTQNETISEVKGSRFNLIFEEDAMAIPTIITNATNSIDARDVGKMPIESSKVTRDASKMYVVVTRSKHPSASTAVKSLAKSTVTHHREMIIDAPRPAKSQVTPSIHKPIFVQNQYATSSVKHARRASHLSASRFAHFNRRDPAIDKRKHIMQLWSIRIVIQILFSKHLPVALLLLRVLRASLGAYGCVGRTQFKCSFFAIIFSSYIVRLLVSLRLLLLCLLLFMQSPWLHGAKLFGCILGLSLLLFMVFGSSWVTSIPRLILLIGVAAHDLRMQVGSPTITMFKDNWKSLPSLSDTISQFTTAVEIELRALLDQEKLLWQQKSHSDGVASGDHNKSYFHRKAKIHQSRNKVSSLRLLDDAWCEDENSLRDTAAIYFRNLYVNSDASSG